MAEQERREMERFNPSNTVFAFLCPATDGEWVRWADAEARISELEDHKSKIYDFLMAQIAGAGDRAEAAEQRAERLEATLRRLFKAINETPTHPGLNESELEGALLAATAALRPQTSDTEERCPRCGRVDCAKERELRLSEPHFDDDVEPEERCDGKGYLWRATRGGEHRVPCPGCPDCAPGLKGEPAS